MEVHVPWSIWSFFHHFTSLFPSLTKQFKLIIFVSIILLFPWMSARVICKNLLPAIPKAIFKTRIHLFSKDSKEENVPKKLLKFPYLKNNSKFNVTSLSVLPGPCGSRSHSCFLSQFACTDKRYFYNAKCPCPHKFNRKLRKQSSNWIQEVPTWLCYRKWTQEDTEEEKGTGGKVRKLEKSHSCWEFSMLTAFGTISIGVSSPLASSNIHFLGSKSICLYLLLFAIYRDSFIKIQID